MEGASKKDLNNVNIPKKTRGSNWIPVEFISKFRLLTHYYCFPMSYSSDVSHPSHSCLNCLVVCISFQLIFYLNLLRVLNLIGKRTSNSFLKYEGLVKLSFTISVLLIFQDVLWTKNTLQIYMYFAAKVNGPLTRAYL